MNELHLFAGAGGGILASQLLGDRCVCAVEYEPYARAVLIARQNDGTFPPFPIWDDVRTFDGRPWRGVAEVVSGGFPCQDISAAGGATASTASAPACGAKWPESSVRYDPASSEWKTAHCLWEEVLPWSSVTLPTWGMTRSGSVYRHPTSERPISGTGAGLWQTIVADDSADRAKGKWNSRGEPKLSAQVLHPEYWPTPTVCGDYNRKGASATSGDGLATVVTQRTWPTATATAYKGWSPNHNRAMTDDRVDYSVERESFQPGQQTPPMRLNPEWVEWLMGWPIGHTGLKPLATGRYQEWLRQHSPRYLDRKESE